METKQRIKSDEEEEEKISAKRINVKEKEEMQVTAKCTREKIKTRKGNKKGGTDREQKFSRPQQKRKCEKAKNKKMRG